jgi:hypothetical protein
MVGSPGTTQWLYTQNTFPRVPLYVVGHRRRTTTAAATNKFVSVIKRLGYDEKYILIAIDACRQHWNSGGDVIPLDARIGDVLDELVKYEDDAAVTTTTTAPTTTKDEDAAVSAAPTTTNDTACKVCRNAYARMALLTCRHVCCCQPCAKKVMAQRDKRCPVCNKDVIGTWFIYF